MWNILIIKIEDQKIGVKYTLYRNKTLQSALNFIPLRSFCDEFVVYFLCEHF